MLLVGFYSAFYFKELTVIKSIYVFFPLVCVQGDAGLPAVVGLPDQKGDKREKV